MTPFLAVVRLGFLAASRSPALRAAAALALVAAFFAPRLVAFAFSGDDALASSAAFGSACLFAPACALFAGVGLASGDRGGDGIAPALRGAAPAPLAVAGTVLGVALAAAAATALLGAAAAAGLALHDRPFAAARCGAALLAASAAALPAASAGILLGSAAPRALAGSLALLLLALIPGPEAFLLARDAAFGALPAGAVALSVAASVALAAAGAAGATAVLRGKELAPRPRSS